MSSVLAYVSVSLSCVLCWLEKLRVSDQPVQEEGGGQCGAEEAAEGHEDRNIIYMQQNLDLEEVWLPIHMDGLVGVVTVSCCVCLCRSCADRVLLRSSWSCRGRR